MTTAPNDSAVLIPIKRWFGCEVIGADLSPSAG